jgi:hypothetical protein
MLQTSKYSGHAMGWKIEKSGFKECKKQEFSLQWPEWLWDPSNIPFNWALVALSGRGGVKWREVAEV